MYTVATPPSVAFPTLTSTNRGSFSAPIRMVLLVENSSSANKKCGDKDPVGGVSRLERAEAIALFAAPGVILASCGRIRAKT